MSDRATPAHAVRRVWKSTVHPTTLVVVASVLVITLVLSVGARAAIDNTQGRALHAQLHQAAAGLQSSIPAMQDPLVAADGIAASVGLHSFRVFAASLVGRRAPFRSVSVWRFDHGRPVAVATVGAAPELPRRSGGFTRFLRSVRPGTAFAVAGLLSPPARGLGFAVRERGVGSRLILYAESALPPSPRTRFAATSPYAGLDVSLYLGNAPSPTGLIETSTPSRTAGPTAQDVVPYGDASVTIVAVLASRPAGELPSGLPWVIGGAGLLLCLVAALTAERLVRRRELAELDATDQESRYTAQRGIAQTLQHSLLPEDRPTHPGMEIAARYVAGSEQLDVGGDWYDVVDIDEDHLFVTVGDVSGRGLAAATVMGSLRPAIRAYAVQGDAPATVLHKLGGLVDVRRDECFATVLCASLDLDRGLVTIASAGHPPALLVANGARFLTTPVAPPVGVARGAPVGSTTYSFPIGSTLIIYTDGLVERRGRRLDEGLEQLRAVADALPGTVDSMLDAILGSLIGDRVGDDVAVLAVRSLRLGATGASWRDLPGDTTVTTRRFTCTSASVRASRDFVAAALDWRRDEPADAERLSELSLAVSELASNAVRHAGTEFEVCVVSVPDDHVVRVGVTDTGGGAPGLLAADPSRTRGRGIRIVDALSQTWGVEWSEDRRSKTVWFEYGSATADATVGGPLRSLAEGT